MGPCVRGCEIREASKPWAPGPALMREGARRVVKVTRGSGDCYSITVTLKLSG